VPGSAATAAATAPRATATIAGRLGLRLRVSQSSCTSDGLPHGAAATLRGLLEVLLPLDVFREALFFTELLEAAEHLIDRLTLSGLDPNGHI